MAKRRGRPPSNDQNKLEFFVYFRRLEHDLILAGHEPTETEMFELVAANGGYELLVAGDWQEIQKAQKNPKVCPQVARMRRGTRCVRDKTTTDLKTMRNFSAICEQEAKNDPTFVPFAEMLLGATQPREIRGHCSGWMPNRL